MLLQVPFPKKWKLKPYFNVSESSDQLRQAEMRYFQDLDGVMLMRSYFLTAHGLFPPSARADQSVATQECFSQGK